MKCPGCTHPMEALVVDAAHGTTVEIDLCWSCRAIWFEQFENVRMTRGSTIELFRRIGEHPADAIPGPLGTQIHCPHCRQRLKHTYDLQRNTRFEYYRCEGGHGRLTRFIDFLKEKDFVRPLSGEQLAELKQNVRTIRCSSCGAPVDLSARTACDHCGSAVSILDMKRLSQLAKGVSSSPDRSRPSEKSERSGHPDPLASLLLADRRSGQSFDLVEWGLEALGNWLRRTL